MEYKGRVKLGRLSNGFESDHGYVVHACSSNISSYCGGKALCGTEPGKKSVGWSPADYPEITCPKCIKKLNKGDL